MKVRSKALYHYLLRADVLSGTEEAIMGARQAYRKEYRRKWKQQKRPRKEIRIEFTLRQFDAIKARAMECGMRHTPYARQAVLSAIEADQAVPRRDELLQVLQLVSMAAIGMAKNTMPGWQIAELLERAERMLLQCAKTQT